MRLINFDFLVLKTYSSYSMNLLKTFIKSEF